MGRGGGGGGGSVGGGSTRFRALRGFFGFGGLSRDSQFILRRVAIAKGLRDVDELLTSLGKQGHDISVKEAFALLEKECGSRSVGDVAEILYYQPGKGYESCNRLLTSYIETLQKADDPVREIVIARKLNRCCGYTDDELQSLKLLEWTELHPCQKFAKLTLRLNPSNPDDKVVDVNFPRLQNVLSKSCIGNTKS